MARKIPVMVCRIKQVPSRDPKFHQAEMLDGLGRSMNELLIIFARGWVFRRFVLMVIVVEYNDGFSDRRSWFKSE